MRPMMTGLAAIVLGATGTAAATAQSTASTYSYGTYNPVQAAINRDSMNAAILRQATGGKHKAAKKTHKVPARHR